MDDAFGRELVEQLVDQRAVADAAFDHASGWETRSRLSRRPVAIVVDHEHADRRVPADGRQRGIR